MGCRWSEVQILSPRPKKTRSCKLRLVAPFFIALAWPSRLRSLPPRDWCGLLSDWCNHRRRLSFHMRKLHHPRLEQQRNEPAPAGLMRSADAAAVVAVKILVK